ncbi:MAG TPA: bifunctional glycosyltransferase family 2/GtrA family protein [Candidatus Sulfopaludibacter sp.]|jgi:glycosyltransferase involved in cell wall biosynthesis|nr:bifunctional glycosyltransferase family 2/GtrA family protein [Candidatus Sulfopaludibacter sp.]
MTGANIVRCAVVIPAYRPTSALLELIQSLDGSGDPILLVDDGSGPDFEGVFARAAAFPSVHLLRHDSNRGKGAALKTAIRYALDAYPDLTGIVTADADGQHHPADIQRVAATLMTSKGCLVLGARAFQGEVPLRSRIGNVLTRSVMHLLLGRKLADTQTGLRGIPVAVLPQLLQLESNGYEFELEMLMLAHQADLAIVEEPIRTIYEAGNKSSHFNPLVDSMKIYFVLLRFASISLLTAVLDNLVFYVAYRRTGHVLGSQVMGRAAGVCFNYWMVRKSVFYSHQRHLSTLPKYLALVVVSGSASYGGIRLLGAALAIPPVAAKLMVESALFFVNFAVQRLVIFRGASESRRLNGRNWTTAAIWILLALIVAVEIYGFRTGNLFAQDIWRPTGLQRFWRYCRILALFSVPVLGLFPRAFVPLVTAAVLVGTGLAAGPLALAAVALFLLSAYILGSRFVQDGILATLLGTGVYILLMLATARAPIQYAAVWTCILLAPIALDLGRTREALTAGARALLTVRPGPFSERAAAALLTFVLGMHWLVMLTPETSADGLAMHLAIPAHMAANHAMTFQPSRILWAVMPMGADWAYSIVYLLGGEFAAHLLNFAMLLAIVGLLYSGARRWVTPAVALLLAALFASSPLVQLVTGSLFVENLLAAMLLGMLTAVWRFGDTGDRRYLLAASFLAGIALTTKLAALPLVLLALPFAALDVRRHWKRVGAAVCVAALLLLAATAAPTYAIAWAKTGNPVFPFLNSKFVSPLLAPDVELRDFRFRQPLTWHTPFDITFHTTNYYEGQNGSLGFQFLLMAPLALLALAVIRPRAVVCAAVVGLAAMTAVLRTEPNVRYLYSSLPLLSIPVAALLGWTGRSRPLLHAALIGYALVCTGLNVYFQPASGWYHKDFYAHYEFRPDGRERFFEEESPIRAVVEHYNRAHPGATMLLVTDVDLADARGNVYENNWHQFATWRGIQASENLPQMAALVERWKLQYFIGRAVPDLPQGLRLFLAQCTETEFEHGGVYLAKLRASCSDGPIAAGTYDNFDGAVRYRGDWLHTAQFPEAWQRSISYTDTPGAEAALTFEGSCLTYVFTRAPNRGIAELLLDGASQGAIDLYSAQIEWQSRYRVCSAATGRHTVTLRVLGKSRPQASGRFVDVDAFIVE